MIMSLCHQKTISSSSIPPANTMDTQIINFPFFQPHHHHPHQNSVFFEVDHHHHHNPTVENSSSFPIPIIIPTLDNISIDSFFKMDPPGVGFLDDVTTVDGLMSCTESLGFESSDERRVDDLIENLDDLEMFCLNKPSKSLDSKSKSKSKFVGKNKIIKMFPPPLSSMSQDGKPVSYLQPMRVDGRLKLTEVRILKAPEVLRASREDGRLRLHLIQDDRDENEDEMIENEEMDHNGVKMQVQPSDDDVADEWLKERAESSLLLSDDHLKMESVMIDDDNCHEERAESDDDDGLVRRCCDGRGKPLPIPSRHHHHHHGPHHKHDIHVWRQQLMC